ncbi:MAG: TIGR03936 family radical SAM-associated protein [Candidatus Brocadiaceae bacterium]|nr:TIGR03936 family radical SAM-associated protein [Candidatus Brocadiaceae bacterium]
MRVRFSKSGDIRFISHHDLMKLFERAIRRANIPIAMSKGFNPHPKLSIPIALGVGISGNDEVLELELLRPMSVEILVECLCLQLPKEIHILSGEVIADSERCLVRDVIYEVVFKNPEFLNTVKVSEFLQQPFIIVNRTKNEHQKSFNIRPSIQGITVKSGRLILSIKVETEGMARPEEVVGALLENGRKEIFEIIRTKINLTSSA